MSKADAPSPIDYSSTDSAGWNVEDTTLHPHTITANDSPQADDVLMLFGTKNEGPFEIGSADNLPDTLEELKKIVASDYCPDVSEAKIVVLYDDQVVDTDKKYKELPKNQVEKIICHLDNLAITQSIQLTIESVEQALFSHDTLSLTLAPVIQRHGKGSLLSELSVGALFVDIPKKSSSESEPSYQLRARKAAYDAMQEKNNSLNLDLSHLDILLRSHFCSSKSKHTVSSGITEKEQKSITQALTKPIDSLYIAPAEEKTPEPLEVKTELKLKPKSIRTPAALTLTAFSLAAGSITTAAYFGAIWSGVLANAAVSASTAEFIVIGSLIALTLCVVLGSLPAHRWRKNNFFNSHLNEAPKEGTCRSALPKPRTFE